MCNDERRTRCEEGYRETTSANGTFCPTIGAEATKVLVSYCKMANVNKTKVVEECVMNYIPVLMKRHLMETMTHEELVDILLKNVMLKEV